MAGGLLGAQGLARRQGRLARSRLARVSPRGRGGRHTDRGVPREPRPRSPRPRRCRGALPRRDVARRRRGQLDLGLGGRSSKRPRRQRIACCDWRRFSPRTSTNAVMTALYRDMEIPLVGVLRAHGARRHGRRWRHLERLGRRGSRGARTAAHEAYDAIGARSTSGRPSSCRRCCSNSWACPRPRRSRPATPPMRRRSRTCTSRIPTRSWRRCSRTATRRSSRRSSRRLRTSVREDGRIHTTFSQAVAVTGRLVPRIRICRTFRSAPPRVTASARRSWWARATRRWSPRTTARSRCVSWRT